MDERVQTNVRPDPARRHTETATEARQASYGRPVLYVLLGGLILGALYLIGTQIWSGSEELPEGAGVGETIPVVEPEATPPAP